MRILPIQIIDSPEARVAMVSALFSLKGDERKLTSGERASLLSLIKSEGFLGEYRVSTPGVKWGSTLSILAKKGYLERVDRGVYRLSRFFFYDGVKITVHNEAMNESG